MSASTPPAAAGGVRHISFRLRNATYFRSPRIGFNRNRLIAVIQKALQLRRELEPKRC